MHSRKADSYNGLREFLAVFNVILFLLGVTMVAVGAWLIKDKEGVLELSNLDLEGDFRSSDMPGFLKASIYMTITVGGFLILESSFSCLAINQMSKCSLVASCVKNSFILLIQVVIVLILVVHRSIMEEHFKSSLHQALATDYKGFIGADHQFSNDFDKAQVQFQCCGIDNYTDFQNFATNWSDKSNLKIPKACCKLDADNYVDEGLYTFRAGKDCAWNPTRNNTNIAKSCYQSIKNWLGRASTLCLLIGAMAVVMEVMNLVLTIILTKKVHLLKKADREYRLKSGYQIYAY